MPRAIVRPPSPAYARCLRSEPVPIDVPRALAQHEAYRRALAEFCEVVVLPPEPDLPDACFVEDTAVIVDGRAVISRPGAPSRRPETESIEKRLPVRGRIERGFLDGGDVMVAGGVAFVGLTARTDRAGAEELGRHVPVRTVPAREWLHLKVAVTPIGPRALVQYRGAYPAGTFEGFEIAETDELAGANVLVVGEDAVVSAAAPETAAMLRARGLRVRVVEVGEFHAGDAGVTCLSLILP
jgi:dimethylargininase